MLRVMRKMFDELKKKIANSRFAPLFIPDNRYGRIVSNINLDLTKNQKKLLLVYIDMVDAGYQVQWDIHQGNSGSIHTNRYELFQMIRSMIELDFCVDVCAHDDIQAQKYIQNREYDIIIGLGEVFRWTIQHKNAYKIIYMTENPYSVSRQREWERIQYLEERTGKKRDFERTGMFFVEGDEEKVDAIICLGDPRYYSHLSKPVERIYPSAFYNSKFKLENVDRRKSCFFVFGTDGLVHKGIDLLVEVFLKHPEWDLYLCGYNISEAIKGTLKKNIANTNIHDCGYIRADSDGFLELVNMCQFILLPSCSEATSTAVLTGMRHGLIPVVMHGNGFDEMDNICHFFEGYTLEEIERTIECLLQKDATEIEEEERKVYEFANQKFTLENYTVRLSEALKHIIDEEAGYEQKENDINPNNAYNCVHGGV